MEKAGKINWMLARFSLLSVALGALGASGWRLALTFAPETLDGPLGLAIAVAVVTAPAFVTYLAISRLAGQIEDIRVGADALAAGDPGKPVSLDCRCEIAGLGDAFRRMVGRFNANVLRMNVLANTDPLTGLPNRAAIEHMLARMVRPGGPGGAVIVIDLDGFKQVNDRFGHAAGDDLLRQAALRVIRQGFGRDPAEIDSCVDSHGELCDRAPNALAMARFASDEFVALQPGRIDEGRLAAVTRAIVAAMSEPFHVAGQDVRIGASVGVARAPIDSQAPDEILLFANLAMCIAKQGGGGRVSFFDPQVRALAVDRAAMEADLRAALAEGGLDLAFQPKLDAASLVCVGVEALARWTHPTRGPIPPSVFVPIAERAGLMGRLGLRVVELAAAQARRWSDEGLTIPVAINVSPQQFENEDLAAELLAVFDAWKVSPSLFEIEITESMAMADLPATRARLDALRAAGVRVSIDDFGVGYSNLSQLSRLAFDDIKIDRSLVADVGENARGESILRALIDMAHALGHRVTAEGVETAAQALFLRKAGCDAVQGFFFARPMTPEALDAWFGQRACGGARALQRLLTTA
jgi:two-component system CheB/CheR fusion protein